MRLLLAADTYPPERISGALQMHDLAAALVRLGHRPSVVVPARLDGIPFRMDVQNGVEVLRVAAPRTKDVPYVQRTLAEWWLPRALLRGLRGSSLRTEKWDGVVWYSPTIFLGPLVRTLKREQGCPSYLIVRDLFPDWAADAGVLRRGGPAYRLFKAVERGQYRHADTIGVQTPSNEPLIARDTPASARIEVLHNWLAPPVTQDAALTPSEKLAGRLLFVYAGNMGVAQDLDAFVELAERFRGREEVGFLLIGRGSETGRLAELALDMPNLDVREEVPPDMLASVLKACHVGIVALHPAHRTHNIPGKLLTYLHAGLPVLARVNAGNDLAGLVRSEGVGRVVEGNDPDQLLMQAEELVGDAALRMAMGQRGRDLARRLFAPEAAAEQIVRALASASPSFANSHSRATA